MERAKAAELLTSPVSAEAPSVPAVPPELLLQSQLPPPAQCRQRVFRICGRSARLQPTRLRRCICRSHLYRSRYGPTEYHSSAPAVYPLRRFISPKLMTDLTTVLVLGNPASKHLKLLERLPDTVRLVATDDEATAIATAPDTDVIVCDMGKAALLKK